MESEIASEKIAASTASDLGLPGLDSPLETQPLAADELLGSPEIAVKATAFEKIRDGGSAIFEKFGLKRGRGRPRHCEKCGKPPKDCLCDQGPSLPASFPLNTPLAPAPVAQDRDPLIIKRSISAMGKAARNFGDKMVFRKAFEASGDKDFAIQVRNETSATNDECDALGEVADILLKELGLDTKYVPLAASLVVLAGAGSRYVLTIKSLNKQILEKQKRQAPPPVKP